MNTLIVAGIAILTGACGGSGDGSPTSPPLPVEPVGNAMFSLAGAGFDQSITYGGGNLVSCSRNAGFADLWVRLAQERAANGDNGPHMDIDICGSQLHGDFQPMDAQSAACSGQSFGIWWHDGGRSFANTLTSSPCHLELNLDPGGVMLTGFFSCSGLRELGGSDDLDVLDGTFQCDIR